MPARDPWPRRLAWAWVAPLTFAVHALGVHPERVGMWGDDALYLSMAESLRAGGALVAAALPGSPGVAKYPLLWPALIAALQWLGASLGTILTMNAALWALTVQLVVSGLLPALGASPRVRLAVAAVLAVNTMTMDLVPQLMSEPLFTLAITASMVILVRGVVTTRTLVALGTAALVAAGSRSVGGLFVLGGAVLLGLAGRRREGCALAIAWALAAVALQAERAMAPPPSADTLAALRYYVSYDVHTGWYAERFAEGGALGLLRGLREIVSTNAALGPKSLGLYLAPSAWTDMREDMAPAEGTAVFGLGVLALVALAAHAPKARPAALLVAMHVGVFLAWTWPFSSRFWLPVFPVVVALAALGLASLGNVGRMLLLPVAGVAVALGAIQPFYAARAALRPAVAESSPDDAELTLATDALARLVRPGDVLVGENYVFWLARPLGASAVELRNLVPFADTLAETFHAPLPHAAENAATFEANLRAVARLVPPERTVWVVFHPSRMEAKRDWIGAAVRAGVLEPEGQFGLLAVARVTRERAAN